MLKYIKETVKNSAIYSVGNISVKLIGLILIPFLTDPELLSTKQYGVLGVLEAVNQILVSLIGVGLYNSLFRWYYEQSDNERKATFFTSGLTVLCFTLISLAVASIFKNDLSLLFFEENTYGHIILLMVFSTCLQTLGQLPSSLLRLQDKAAFFTSANIIKLVITLLVTLYLIIWEKLGLKAIYLGQIAGFFSFLVVLTPYMLKNIKLRFYGPVFSEMFGYGFSMMVAGLSAAAINILDRFVLNSMSGLEEVAFYSLGYKVASVLKVVVISSVSMALMPIIFRKITQKNNQRFYKKTLTYYGFGMMICIMGISLFSEELLKVFTGSSIYWQSYKIIPILSFSLYFVALKDVVLIGLHITKKTSRISLITIVVSVLNLLLNILLIPYLGAEGAALASLVSQLIFLLGAYYYSNKEYPIAFEWNKIILIFFTGLAIVYLALLTNDMNIWLRLLIKISLFLSFPFILYQFKFYEKIELQTLSNIWSTWKNLSDFKQNIIRLLNK